MTIPIPFLSFFKKVKDQAFATTQQSVAARKHVQPAEKPSSERFSKTVMPNATRSLSPHDSFATSASMGQMASSVAVAPSPSRTIAFGATAPAARPSDLPPAVALALEPMVERVVTLDLADIASQIPPNYIKPIESIDGTRRILLKAAEVEKGMSNKRPAISLATVYQQVPEIFLRAIAPSDETQVRLPFSKVLEQFASLQVRTDQERHQAVPQVETPFLKVTLEDNNRFGTSTGPVEIVPDLPPVRIQPATAEALAAAEPDSIRQADETALAKPTRISIEISPNGTGGSAPESVPASSGPSVPTSFVTPPAPTRIPFKLAPAGDSVPSQHDPCSTQKTPTADIPAAPPAIAPFEQSSTPVADDSGPTISLALKPILRGLPPTQFSGDVSNIPGEAQIELPFSLIEPQLVTGRIMVRPSIFAARLPEEFRSMYNEAQATDVLLPLQEVLKNLPESSLKMRADQEEQESGPTIATPFSAKAEEDAKRFKLSTPVPTDTAGIPAEPTTSVKKDKVVFGKKDKASGKKDKAPGAEQAAAPQTPVAEQADAQTSAAPETKQVESAPRTQLQVMMDVQNEPDDKAVVAFVNKLPGIKSCALMFADGLSLAGALPPESKADGLCAMAPSLMQKIEKHIAETNLGALRGITLLAPNASITFFTHENLCLAALHESAGMTTEVQEKLSQVVHALSQKYSSPV